MMTKARSVTLKPTQKMGRPITWSQVDNRALEGLSELTRRAPKSAQLMLVLIPKMLPGAGGVVVVSRETMRGLMACSMPTLDRALKLLIAEGWIQRIRIGGASAICINRRIAWVGSRGDMEHAVFSATVIASRAEQDAAALDPPPLRLLPTLEDGDLPWPIGPGLDPPSQAELDGLPPPVIRTPKP